MADQIDKSKYMDRNSDEYRQAASEALEPEGLLDVVKPYKKTALQKMQEAGLPDMAAKVIDVAVPDGLEGYAGRGAGLAGRALGAAEEVGKVGKASQIASTLKNTASRLRKLGLENRAGEADEAAASTQRHFDDPYWASKTKPVPKWDLGK